VPAPTTGPEQAGGTLGHSARFVAQGQFVRVEAAATFGPLLDPRRHFVAKEHARAARAAPVSRTIPRAVADEWGDR